MASLEQQIAEDNVAIEDYRAKFGDEKAAEFAAQLYILRRTPPPVAVSNTGGWSGLPRWLIILIAVWIGLLETADKLPQLLLAIPQYEASLAEYHAKLLQPDLVTVQLEKAKFDAKKAEIDAAGFDVILSPANGIESLTPDKRRQLICRSAELREKYGQTYHCDELGKATLP